MSTRKNKNLSKRGASKKNEQRRETRNDNTSVDPTADTGNNSSGAIDGTPEEPSDEEGRRDNYADGEKGYFDENGEWVDPADKIDTSEEPCDDEDEEAKRLAAKNATVDALGKKFGLQKPVKKYYCNNSELIPEIKNYEETGIMSDKLANFIILIAAKMTGMARFRGYSELIKDELVGNAIYRMASKVGNFDLKNKKANAFGYLSMISYRDMLVTLKKHFKQDHIKMNLRRANIIAMGDSSIGGGYGMSQIRSDLEENENESNRY
jgi:hypothetical protein